MIILQTTRNKILLIIFTVICLETSSFSAVITSNSSGGNWDNPASWIGGIVPGPGDDVIIVSTAVITVTADTQASSLDVAGKIILNDGVTLTINGNVTVETGGSLYLTGYNLCIGNNISILIVYGNYTNYGYTCFWKSWVIIAGDLYSPSASGIENNGILVIGGNAIGVIDQTGGNSVYPINPEAIVSLSGTIPITTAPTSPEELVTIIETVIFGGSSCGFAINGPVNDTTCIDNQAYFTIISTTATSPTYQWEENRGNGWNPLINSAIYSGVTTSDLSIYNTAGMDGFIYRCKITNASSCSKYSFSATLTVLSVNSVGNVGTISGPIEQCSGQTNQVYSISPVTYATEYSWSVPSDWIITSGEGTTNITVTTGSAGQDLNISVVASNSCSSNSNFITVTVNNIPGAAGNISGPGSVCIGTTGVSYSVPAIPDATGYVWNLPAGTTIASGANTNNITVNFSSSAISGNLTVYGISICGNGTTSTPFPVTVIPDNTINIISEPGTNNQTRCINSSITNIVFTTTGATGVTVTGLPAGVTGSWSSNIVSISGTPTVPGTFNYMINLSGGCGTVTATGTIIVTPDNTITLTSGPGTNNQTICINTALTNITYSTTGASGATFTGLPAGVTGSWGANVVTISGIPSVSGTFNYTVNLSGGCGVVSSGGTIIISQDNTMVLTSGPGTNNQTSCINTPIINITYSTMGASGATFTGLPAGVSGMFAGNNITISGTPTVSGTFNFTVILSGGCGTAIATGTITITADNIIALISGAGTDNQTKCINTMITSIVYFESGATGATVTGLPLGVTFKLEEDIVLIDGTPATPGTFNYTLTLTGGCGVVTANGTITVIPQNIITLTSPAGTNNQTRCINTPITDVVYTITGATGASVNGLPAGITGNWAGGVFTISGVPSEPGVFNYTVALTGGCEALTAVGTIIVTQSKPVELSVAADRNPLCEGDIVTLTVSPQNEGLAPLYQWKVNGLDVGSNSSTYSYIPLDNDEITVVLTSNENCATGNPAVSNQVIIKVNPYPSAPTIQSVTQPTCKIPTGSIILSNLPSEDWTINPGNIKGNSSNTTIIGLNPGTYAFTVTNSTGCISLQSQDVSIELPVTSLSCSITAKSDVLCNGGNTGSIVVAGTGGKEPYRYKLDSQEYQNSGTFSFLVAGTYVVTVQDANLCTSTVQAEISEPPKLVVTYSATNASGPMSSDGKIEINILGGTEPFIALWSDGASTINRNDIAAGTYHLILTDYNGCEVSLEITIDSESNEGMLEIQEIITPNGDGFYDTWKIKNIEMYPNAEVKVYSRWGKLVFSTKNISDNEWDGTINGQLLPTDSYRYVLYLEKGIDPVTGTVTIVR